MFIDARIATSSLALAKPNEGAEIGRPPADLAAKNHRLGNKENKKTEMYTIGMYAGMHASKESHAVVRETQDETEDTGSSGSVGRASGSGVV